jgi:hypothetical protein
MTVITLRLAPGRSAIATFWLLMVVLASAIANVNKRIGGIYVPRYCEANCQEEL